MQCSCGDITKTAHYQRIIHKDDKIKVVEYASQEICVNCGRATQVKIEGTQTFQKVKKK